MSSENEKKSGQFWFPLTREEIEDIKVGLFEKIAEKFSHVWSNPIGVGESLTIYDADRSITNGAGKWNLRKGMQIIGVEFKADKNIIDSIRQYLATNLTSL
jgi:hypothetical protein